jgi:uncharacterized protein YpmS
MVLGIVGTVLFLGIQFLQKKQKNKFKPAFFTLLALCIILLVSVIGISNNIEKLTNTNQDLSQRTEELLSTIDTITDDKEKLQAKINEL